MDSTAEKFTRTLDETAATLKKAINEKETQVEILQPKQEPPELFCLNFVCLQMYHLFEISLSRKCKVSPYILSYKYQSKNGNHIFIGFPFSEENKDEDVVFWEKFCVLQM